MSKFATLIAKKGLGIDAKDPMSGFFAFKKNILNGLNIDAIGYKILLEILVKTKNVTITELYQELPEECRTLMKECTPLSEIEENRKEKQKITFDTWKKTK